MNLLFSCIGQRGYVADFFRPHLSESDQIVGTGNTRWTPGFLSCDKAFLLPDISDDDYLPAVLELCEREKIHAILSFSDPDVYRLSHAADEFAAIGVTPLLPSMRAAEICFDKVQTFRFLREHGIATPETVLTLDEAERLELPLYVKPRRGSGSRSTFLARTRDELKVFFSYEDDMIVQEAVMGEEIDIELCGALDGRPVGISIWRKLRSRMGETERAETFRDPGLIEFGLELGALLRVRGPMDLDVIRTGDDLHVLEFNPRFGGGYPVSHLAGADFPKLLIDLLRHGTTDENFGFSPSVVMMKRLQIIGGPSDSFFEGVVGR